MTLAGRFNQSVFLLFFFVAPFKRVTAPIEIELYFRIAFARLERGEEGEARKVVRRVSIYCNWYIIFRLNGWRN